MAMIRLNGVRLPVVTIAGRPWAPLQGARLLANDHAPRRLLVAVHYYAVTTHPPD